MRPTHFALILCFFLTTIALPVDAATREEKRVADSTDVLDQLLRIPERSIPPSLLSRAYAVAVIPNVVKVGFGLAARRGRGILVVRQDDDSWSNPAFITLTGGSIGWQIGAQSTDVVLVFKSRKGVDRIDNGTFTLGADASIAAGPVGRQASAATDIGFQAEVVSYSRNRGLFAGVSFEGAGVTMDRHANVAFYGDSSMSPAAIFSSSPNIAPPTANTFVQMLTAQTRRLPKQAGMQAAATTSPVSDPGTESTVKTFGMPDPGEEPADADDSLYEPND
jgi:lipid-binding SYLF domain-containing protein